jgi:predicted kinase
MAKVVIGIGLPGAGKSTTLKKFSDKYGYFFVRVDDFRKLHNLTPADPSTEAVWDDIRSKVIEHYRKGETVVIDATFLGDIRKRFIEFARQNGVSKIQGVLVDTPEELAWARNQSREERTSRELFEDRLAHLRSFPPEIADGFDSFFVVNEKGELTQAELAAEQVREFRPRSKFS